VQLVDYGGTPWQSISERLAELRETRTHNMAARTLHVACGPVTSLIGALSSAVACPQAREKRAMIAIGDPSQDRVLAKQHRNGPSWHTTSRKILPMLAASAVLGVAASRQMPRSRSSKLSHVAGFPFHGVGRLGDGDPPCDVLARATPTRRSKSAPVRPRSASARSSAAKTEGRAPIHRHQAAASRHPSSPHPCACPRSAKRRGPALDALAPYQAGKCE
jgi:hypothetical protein